jgi:sporulation protein YlmC with PRC-barrel domain
MRTIATLTAVVLVAFVSMVPLAYAGGMEKSSLTGHEKSQFIGAKVENLQGENLGSIKEVVTNSEGKTTFAILSHGGVMGIGDKEVAVPFEALSYQADTKHFTLDVTKEKLASAPEFKKGADLNDRSAAEEVYRFYGITPRWEEGMKKEEGLKKEEGTEKGESY